MKQTPELRPQIRVRETAILATDSRQQYREKLARITLDSMVQFVGLLDAQGTVLEINKVALDAVGIKLADVEGKPFWTTFWWQVSDEIRTGLIDGIARAARGEFVRWDTPIYGRAGGKETIVIDASLCPVKDEHGTVVFIAAEGRDITQKNAYEQEIARKNVELQGLLERISELDEVKTQFFANVSHELRTPLALIIGPAERLQNAGGDWDVDRQRETVQVILRNARMLLRHVNDLLDVSKLEAGKLRIELQDTDVAALVRVMGSHFDVLAAERGIAFEIETPPWCAAPVDAAKLQRVVMNLLSNAFKFAPAGGSVRCTLQTTNRALLICVEDSGPGVQPEQRTAIFERFRQVDGGANRQVSGTGLGLAIAHEFVEMHRGTIEVGDSVLGGARFLVRLPARAIAAPANGTHEFAPAQVLDPSTLHGLIEELSATSSSSVEYAPARVDAATGAARGKVLVVEDNPDMNRFVAQCLSRSYDVICAFDGRQGMDRALADTPDLIVSDIMMPGVSGEQMLAEMRKVPALHETPILLLSAKADEDLKHRLLEEGAQDFITKPFTERELLVRARNLVEGKRSKEALREAERVNREAIEAANRELAARSRQLGELFEQAPGFMVVLRGPEHVFELANAAFYRLVGHREMMGRTVFDALPEVKVQGFIDLLDNVRSNEEPYIGKAVPVLLRRDQDGELEQRYVDFVFQPLRDVDGAVSGIFVEGTDVTDRKRAEDALRAADRRKDEFLATLAHELRNPLAPIRHAATISKMPRSTEAQKKWAQDVIDRQVDHMARLLDDLLEVSRITRGKLELRKERLVLNDSLAAAVETARPLIEAREHRLVVDLPSAPVHIEADPVRFAQIFGNLLTNAAKYTDPGGLIHVRARIVGTDAVISVQDNGIGISPELLPQLFEMFTQATSALDRSEGGLGIGLSLARGLVAMHGGTIEARSAGLGMGSEFEVKLPVMCNLDDGADGDVDPSALQAAGRQRLRVLVADDNRDNADSSAMLLRMAGHEVRTAYSGREALTIAAGFEPQIALLDIGMPEMNGYEVARHMRATAWGARMLLVAVTGWGQDDDRRRAEAAGFDHHLAKPVDLATLEPMLVAQQAERAQR